MNILYSMRHLGYMIPPQAGAGWIGKVEPGAPFTEAGSDGHDNDCTNRNTTVMTWNLLHIARMPKDIDRLGPHGNQRSLWDFEFCFDFPQFQVPVSWAGRYRNSRSMA